MLAVGDGNHKTAKEPVRTAIRLACPHFNFSPPGEFVLWIHNTNSANDRTFYQNL
ncbi:hypothetical protein DPMN_160216 [Dreissena polymorpha]|uniref:Uncharacterized protein n=1 Tax=Dreissena polymorpha TaxID=45954 RepID=A0A9D4IRG9_DREPO|nr:hypothetical protein DPMN_160216 [Dreissena polymorpha]